MFQQPSKIGVNRAPYFRSLIYQRDLQEIVTALEQQHQIDPIAIELVDPSVARLYKEGTRSKVYLLTLYKVYLLTISRYTYLLYTRYTLTLYKVCQNMIFLPTILAPVILQVTQQHTLVGETTGVLVVIARRPFLFILK